MLELDTLKLLLDFAVIPAVIFAYKMYAELGALRAGQEGIRGSIKELGILIRESEKDNRTEHKELGTEIHKLELANKVEHAILSNGGKL